MNLSAWLLKEEDGRIFKSCDISLENMPTLHSVSLVLFMYTYSAFAMLFCHTLAYKDGFCLHLLVPPLV